LVVVWSAVALGLAGLCAWGAVTGVISGSVTDAETRAELSGVNISVEGAGLSTVTDSHGRFVITNVPPGAYTVGANLIGYRPAKVTGVVVVQGQASEVPVALEAALVPAAGAEAKVTAARVALRRDVTSSVYVATAADEQMTLSQPNDRYQFPGLVFAQPGVVPDNTFYPHIRGARVNQVGYFLDGIPITDPDANVFATNIVSIGLDRMELFTGGYPIEYGGWTGGIINQVVKRGDQMRGGLVDVGAGSPYDFGGLTVERGDVDGRADWYYGLYSWHTKFVDNLFTSAAPTVSDHIAKVIYDAGARDKITVLSLHDYARYLFPFERMFTFDPDILDWTTTPKGSDFGRQGCDLDSVALNHTLSPTAFWNLRVSRLRHFVHLELGDPDNLFWQHRNERIFTGQFDYQRQVGGHRLAAGLWQINSDNNSAASIYLIPAELIANHDTSNAQVYLQDTWRYNDRVTLTGGVRHDRMKYDRPESFDLNLSETSGRAGLTYVLSPKVMLRSSYGRYVEFPRANLLGYTFAGLDIGWYAGAQPDFRALPQLDRGRDLGMEWKLDPNSVATATWFDRRSRQMMQKWQGITDDAAGFDASQPVRYASDGTGTTRGVEVKLDRRLSQNLRGWLSYTHMDAKATSAQDNLYPFGYGDFLMTGDPAALTKEFPVDWNQKNTASLALLCKAGKLSVNPWVLYGSGFPYWQSGLDAGGSDPAHLPNPNYNPDDPTSPEELLVPQNLVDPNDPSKFISPNSLETGKNLTVSLNLAYQVAPERQVYFQIYNLFDREDVTSYVIFHPRTGAVLGRIEGDSVYYVPFSKTPPRFVAFGVRQEF
jgi:outer membrane receptor protein involved in Fe transport